MVHSDDAHSKDMVTVERLIPASAAMIFDLLADPARHTEIDGSGSVRDANSGATKLELGSKFGMSMKAGIGYSMQNTIIEFEQDRRIAWQTRPPNRVIGMAIGGRIWRYELEPADGGTLVRETWDITQEQVKWMVRPLATKTKAAMEKTLERIEQVLKA